MREYVQLLDIKAARVKKLEGQLKEIAYGTRPYRLDTSKFEYGGGEGSMEEGEAVVELERGQNLLQFHISVVCVTIMNSVMVNLVQKSYCISCVHAVCVVCVCMCGVYVSLGDPLP